MPEENNELKTWEEVIKEYINTLDDHDKKEEYLDELISWFYFGKCIQAKAINKSDKKVLIKDLKKIRETPITHKKKLTFEGYYLSFIQRGWIESCDFELALLKRKHCFYNIWICRALLLGYAVQPATHVAKLTHSSSDGLSLLDNNTSINSKYITTSSLKYKYYDGAYPNASLSKIVKFMMLSNDVMLSEEINNGNSAPLSGFATDIIELDRWMKGFQYNLNPSPSTDSLAKQIYFPVENDYHMLVVTKSSSLIHALFLNNFEKSVNLNRTKLYKYIEKHHYNEQIYQCHTNIGKVFTTLSQPQNISILNGKRGGRLHLFSCNPPIWQSQLKPPFYKKSLFDIFQYLPTLTC